MKSFPEEQSSLRVVYIKKSFLKNFAKFTGKHLCQRLFLNNVAGLSPATLLRKRLWHRWFPVPERSGYFSRFSKKGKERPPPYPLAACVNLGIVLQLILIFLASDKKNGFIFELQILAIETTIEKQVFSKKKFCVVTVVHFRFYHIIFQTLPY